MTILILFGSYELKRISVEVSKNNYESWITIMKMLTRESTIETWTKFLPNIKDTEQLEQYIKNTGDIPWRKSLMIMIPNLIRR